MKIIATQAIELFGTRYAVGDTLDVSEEAAERLLRSRQARIEAGELLRHLKGRRLYAPAGMAADMRVRRG